jgi:transcription elongation factor GreA
MDNEMTYLEEFKKQIDKKDVHKFFQLWEEYCTNDQVDTVEFIQLLKLIKKSDFAKHFGQFVETALPLLEYVNDEKISYEILKHLIDLQTTNSPLLAETSLTAIQKRFKDDPLFQERIRLVGLRSKENFQGAVGNYELLAHMEIGNCVFHTGGWGTGEIIEVSPLRQQVSCEFENVTGIKHITFENSFKTLIPLSVDNFLARRFSQPDALEAEAKKDPVTVLKMMLRDLGNLTAGQIKDELAELVIPEKDWTKWWQNARTKIKKDTMVQVPEKLSEQFVLRSTELSHEESLLKAIQHKVDPATIIQTSYTYVRDFPNVLKNEEVKKTILEKLLGLLDHPALTKDLELQLLIFLETSFKINGKALPDYIQKLNNIEDVINAIDIAALKKRALVLVKENHKNWKEIFSSMFFSTSQGALRDYIVSELNKEDTGILLNNLEELLLNPEKHPEVFFWYFQKIALKDGEGLPLIHKIEHDSQYRDLLKKMYNFITTKRYEVLRQLIDGTSLEFIHEFLLLVSKCHVFNDQEKKTFRALCQVVHPSLAPIKESKAATQLSGHNLWTTEAGYNRTQERIKYIATIEMIENSREVEAARALGDLRENAEYKFACEKRSRLQGEMRHLSQQLNRARVITPQDVFTDEIGVGAIVQLEDTQGNQITYTILGPWDASVEDGIISFQSKLGESMIGRKIGDVIKFREEEYKVIGIKSFLDK